ncbi:MAG TPA: acyl-CoA dehydrogenase, partial [Pseudorhizobium sp.]|nr:acyl-CoA dehydrogenase [Pseudorhizobium sp.]
RGLAVMFTMMNSARLAVAMQGVAVGERATQAAFDFASERRQGRTRGSAGMATIDTHPDVWRMLMTMRSTTTAARFIALSTADAIDRSRRCATEDEREAARIEADILTPIAKAYCTDSGIEMASFAIQIHGGMGYVEDTGIAQLWRDARVTSIYEGTNGIHAIDFLTRKLVGSGAPHFLSMIDRFEQTAAQLAVSEPELAAVGDLLGNGCRMLRARLTDMMNLLQNREQDALCVATPFLRLAALVTGGCLMARAVVARAEDPELRSSLDAALRFFALFVLSDTVSISNSIVNLRRFGRNGETMMPDVVRQAPEAGVYETKPRHQLGEKA